MNQSTATLDRFGTRNRTVEPSLQTAARVAGILYLVIIIAGIFAEFYVRSSLIVPGDAAATASNIMASEALFRSGIASDLIMILCDVALALIFYVLLKPVSSSLALLAAFFRLAQAAILGINLLNLFFVLQLTGGAGYLTVFSGEQLDALVLLFMDAHATGYTIGLVFFGLQCFVLGYLIFKSGYLPKILGVLLIFSAFGYSIDGFARALLADYAANESIFLMAVFALALIAELSLSLWLIVKGVTIPQRDTLAPASP